MSVRERIAALLQADPLCNGRVASATIDALSEVAGAPIEIVDADVSAERAACVAQIQRVFDRLCELEGTDGGGEAFVCPEAFHLELRRMDATIEGVRHGLHRITERKADGHN